MRSSLVPSLALAMLLAACGPSPGDRDPASGPEPARGPAYAPPDPFDPWIWPSLAGCEWIARRDLPADVVPDAITTTLVHDTLGRIVRTTFDQDDGDGVRWHDETDRTWDGTCVIHEVVGATYEGGVDSVSTTTSDTTCDDHDSPIERHTDSTTDIVLEDGTLQPSSSWSSDAWYENHYDGDLLVEVVEVLEDGSPIGSSSTFEWAEGALVGWRVAHEVGTATTASSEALSDGEWNSAATYTWDGARLVGATYEDDDVVGLLMETDYLYEGETWLGSDLTITQEGEPSTLQFRYVYDGGRFPVVVQGVGLDGEVTGTDITVTCL